MKIMITKIKLSIFQQKQIQLIYQIIKIYFYSENVYYFTLFQLLGIFQKNKWKLHLIQFYNYFMGSCASDQVQQPGSSVLKQTSLRVVESQSDSDHEEQSENVEAVRRITKKLSKESIDFSQKLLKNSTIAQQLSKKMDTVAHSFTQSKDITRTLIQGIIDIQKDQQSSQKQFVKSLFDNKNIDEIKQQKLFYYQMLSKINEDQSRISESVKSRIYHTIANIKKDKEVNKSQKIPGTQIDSFVTNAYKKLSETDLDEVVKFQTIAQKVRKMGDNINFKYQFIKRQSQKIQQVITKIMADYRTFIKKMDHDLGQKEALQMAKISRESCSYYDNGIHLLLVYLVKSCRRLEKNDMSSEEIEQYLDNLIKTITRIYPPGEGLSKEQEGSIKQLKSICFMDDDEYKLKHAPVKLSPQNKQAQV